MKTLFLGLTIFALVGLIVPMTAQTSYGLHPECFTGNLSSAELKPTADINGNGFICVIKIIETSSGTIVIAVDDHSDSECDPTVPPGCPN